MNILIIISEQIPENIKISFQNEKTELSFISDSSNFGIQPFLIQKGNYFLESLTYSFNCKTISKNIFKLLRALQMNKPILLVFYFF